MPMTAAAKYCHTPERPIRRRTRAAPTDADPLITADAASIAIQAPAILSRVRQQLLGARAARQRRASGGLQYTDDKYTHAESSMDSPSYVITWQKQKVGFCLFQKGKRRKES
jgi:hypothetical protein